MSDHPNAIDLGEHDNLTEASHEVMRVWVTDSAGSSAWIDARLLDDPKVFGFLIADTVRHAAEAYSETYGLDPASALQSIVDGAILQLRNLATINPTQPGSLN